MHVSAEMDVFSSFLALDLRGVGLLVTQVISVQTRFKSLT